MRQLLIASLVAACLSGCGQSERCPSGAACDRVPGPLGDTRLTGVPPADGGFRAGMTDPSPRYQAAIAYDPPPRPIHPVRRTNSGRRAERDVDLLRLPPRPAG